MGQPISVGLNANRSLSTQFYRRDIEAASKIYLTTTDRFKIVKHATNLKPIMDLILQAFRDGVLDWCLCLPNSKGKSLLSKIIKQSFSHANGYQLLSGIFHLCITKSMTFPLFYQPSSYQPLEKWITSSHQPDLTDKELTILRTQRKYQRMLAFQSNNRELPEELRPQTWSSEEVRNLTNKETQIPEQTFIELLNLDEMIANSKNILSQTPTDPFPIFHSRAGDLLHKAVAANKPNIVKYLIEIGTNVNSLTQDNQSIILRALSFANKSTNHDSFSSILKMLLDARTPISATEFAAVLQFCRENRRELSSEENRIHNYHLYNHVISQLLGITITISTTLSQKNIQKYQANYTELGGVHVNTKVKKNACKTLKAYLENLSKEEKWPNETTKLTGFYSHIHQQMHLRIRLEVILEDYLERGIHDDEVIKEFLYSLETAWVITRIKEWKILNIKNDREKLEFFCRHLSDYLFRQINHLSLNEEYTLNSGWKGHAICVVFKKVYTKQAKVELEIRIDNLGSGSSANHPTTPEGIKPRILASLPYPISVKNTLKLKEYLTRLINNKASRYSKKKCAKNDLYGKECSKNHPFKRLDNPAKKKHHPLKGLIQPIQPNSYPAFPAQKKGSGSCVTSSASVGPRIRNPVLFDNLLSLDLGRLATMLRLYRTTKDTRLQVNWVNPSKFEYRSFINQLATQLQDHYVSIDPANSLPYYMAPLLIDTYRQLDEDTFCLESTPKEMSIRDIEEVLFPEAFNFPMTGNPRIRSRISTSGKGRRCRISIVGKAGSGKTQLARTLSRNLQEKHSDMVLHIPLENLSNQEKYPPGKKYTLIDIIQQEVIRPALKRELKFYEHTLLEEFINHHQSDCLWVLDGLDKLNPLPDLIEATQELLKQERVIVTSRSGIIQEQFKHDCLFTIADYYGYSRYIENFFTTHQLDRSSTQSHSEQREKRLSESQDKLFKALQDFPQLKELCLNPLTLRYLCKTWLKGNVHLSNFVGESLVEINHRLLKSIPTESHKHPKTAFDILKTNREVKHLLQRLAFSSKQHPHSTPSQIDILPLEELEDQEMGQTLKSMNIFQSGPYGRSFIYSSLIDYFAAEHLAKILHNPENASTEYQKCQEFILHHRKNLNDQSLFLQTICLLRKKQHEFNPHPFNRLMEGFTDQTDRPVSAGFYLQMIPIVEAILKIVPPARANEELMTRLKAIIESSWEIVKEKVFMNGLSWSFTFSERYKTISPEEREANRQTLLLCTKLSEFFSRNPLLREEIHLSEKLIAALQEKAKNIKPEKLTPFFEIANFAKNSKCLTQELVQYVSTPDKKLIGDGLKIEFVLDRICVILEQNQLTTPDRAELSNLNEMFTILFEGVLPFPSRCFYYTNFSAKIGQVLSISQHPEEAQKIARSCIIKVKTYVNRFFESHLTGSKSEGRYLAPYYLSSIGDFLNQSLTGSDPENLEKLFTDHQIRRLKRSIKFCMKEAEKNKSNMREDAIIALENSMGVISDAIR